MTDPCLAADSVPGQSLAGPAGGGLLSSGDEYVAVGEGVVAGIRRETAVERYLARFDPQA
jgi:hypothetical protein